MTEVSGLLVDLDGVVRLWPRGSARAAALACGLPRNAVREIAYDDAFDLAHHGILTHEQWVDQVRARLRERHGPAGERAAGLWAADRGEPDPAMVRLLLRARAAGLTVGVLTNNTTAVRADLARHGLEDLFDQVANSADLGVTKPAPAAYRAALEMMDLPPARVAFTDDNPLNTTAAAYVGLHAHPYTTPDAFETFLRTLGIVLPTTTPTSGRARPGCPAGVPPAPGHAESDAHAPVRVRYLETSRTPQAVARALTGPGTVAVPLEEGAVATVTDSGRVTTWRLLAAGTDPAVAAGDLSAWTPTPAAGVTAAGGVTAEHLPPWLPDTRTAGGASAARLLDRTGWDLAQLAARTRGGDVLAAAHHLDRVRHHLTALATLLARHQPRPWPGTTATRYLPTAARTALAASWTADPTTPTGLTHNLTALLQLLRHLRHTAHLVLDTAGTWPWDRTATALTPILAARPDLSPRPAGDPLYTPALAAVYDRHRPVDPEMAAALAAFAAQRLTGREVVELGAGTGRITRHLAPPTARYDAVEPSPAMAVHLTAADIPGVEVTEADALCLPWAGRSRDIVVEHETLQFTADPLRAADEALRVLRPGGALVRLLLHPAGPDPHAVLDTAYRQGAFTGGPLPLFHGKGTDLRGTAHLTALGLDTTTTVLTEFVRHRTPHAVLAALADRAWPYQHQFTDAQHERGMTAAHHTVAGPGDEPVPVPYVLRALTTTVREEP